MMQNILRKTNQLLCKPLLLAGAATIALMISANVFALDKITVFSQPIPHYDSIWMADAKGFYKDEGLDVEFRQFSSGTVALQTFKTGQGDLILGGDFPQVNYWLNNEKQFRVIAALEEDSEGYFITTAKSITKAQDLKGKTIGLRVGSTMDWFLSEYLAKNGMSKSDVTIRNLDGSVMPTALCKGDVDAFVYWQPYNDKAIELCPNGAHNLTSASGYVSLIVLVGARPAWLENPENARKAAAFLRATLKGKEVAKRDYAAVEAYGKEKFSMPPASIKAQWTYNSRLVDLNTSVFQNYCKLFKWMRQESLLQGQIDLKEFMWTDALKAVNPALVSPIPPPC